MWWLPPAPADRPGLVSEGEVKAGRWAALGRRRRNGATTATYTSQSSGDIVITGRLESALNHALAMERMTARGMKPAEVDALLKDVKVDTLQVDKEGKEVKSSGFG